MNIKNRVNLLIFCSIAASFFCLSSYSKEISDELIIKTPDNMAVAANTDEYSEVKLNLEDKNILPIQDLKGKIGTNVEKTPFKSWIEGDYATGNWFGLRTKLKEHGITLGGTYMNNDFMKIHGGISKKNQPLYQGILTLSAEIDTEKAHLWKGGTAFVSYMNNHGRSVSRDYVGDLLLVNAYEASRFNQLSEYWYKHRFFNDKLLIKAGKQDINFDFCALNAGFQFSNAGFYLENIPIVTYPNPGLGIMGEVKPFEWLTIKSGWFDGESDGNTLGFKTMFNNNGKYLNIHEINIMPNIKNHKGKYMIGGWLNTGDVDEITTVTPRTFSTNYGLYSGFEQIVYKENSEDDQGLTILGQFGWAPSDRREIARYYGLGLTYTGLIPTRNKDIAGIGSNFARMSGRLASIEGRHGESVIELFYNAKLNNWLSIQPDLQYVYKPSGSAKNAYVLGIRTLISL